MMGLWLCHVINRFMTVINRFMTVINPALVLKDIQMKYIESSINAKRMKQVTTCFINTVFHLYSIVQLLYNVSLFKGIISPAKSVTPPQLYCSAFSSTPHKCDGVCVRFQLCNFVLKYNIIGLKYKHSFSRLRWAYLI